ncbi:MAG TPA: MBL fold metallo-hydrolase [Methylomirabilota bacterium]|nr:MBL fold metallo-hydrolase [Methylomirabilota bacterium]
MRTPNPEPRTPITTATLTERVGRVLGLNPGLMTGPGTNTYLVGQREPLLIDTGAGVPEYFGELERYLRDRGIPTLHRVVLTHRHSDHMGGVAGLRQKFLGLSVSKFVYRDSALPGPISSIKDGDVIEAVGATLVAIHTPGHASDHLCYYLREEKALFTGDLILGGSTTVIPPDDGDLAQYMASLHRLLDLDVERIYPGHGPVIEPAKAKIHDYINHRLERDRQILDAISAGCRTVPQMVARIYVDVSPALHPVAQLSVQSHLIKLKREGRVREESSGWSVM